MSNTSNRISNLSPEEKRVLLAQLLRKKASKPKSFPLSFAQQRLWFLDQLQSGSPFYNIPIAIRLRGQLNVTVLEESLNEIVRRHEVLRTTFATVDGQPIQIIAPVLNLTLPLIDLRGLRETDQEITTRQLATEVAQRPFDLTQGSLLQGILLQLGDEEYVLLLTMHHIVSDGWSMGVLVQEVAALYSAFCTGNPSPLPELPIQYVDFAQWQRQWLQGEVLESQLTYWTQQLAGAPAVMALPTDRPRPPVQTFRGAIESFRLPVSLSSALKALSQKEGATLFMTLLAAFKILLYRYTCQQDILVGSPIANRNRSQTEGLIGFFVNTLVLRTQLFSNLTFCELLSQVRSSTLAAYAHQDLPFEKLVEELHHERSLSYSPLFQVMFVLQNAPMPALNIEGLTLTPLEFDSKTAKFDLTLGMEDREQGLVGFIEYNTDLFDTATISRILRHFQTLLQGIAAHPEQQICQLPLLTESERHQLLVEWNDTKQLLPQQQCIHQLFEVQVQQTPDAVAVVFEDQQLTYQELNQRANQLAHYLQTLGVKPDVLVGICIERCVEMVVGLLGILKAGGAYVPLDPAYPTERLALMLENTQTPLLLTQQRLVTQLPPSAAQLLCLDANWNTIALSPQENPVTTVTDDNLAYVIYTSGSTGIPKGVSVVHRGVVRLVKGSTYANLSAEEVFLQLAPISFDAATFEIWGSLLWGARLVVMPLHTPSLKELGNALGYYQVTTLWLTAGLFHLMVDEQLTDLKNVRQLLAGGDILSVPHVHKLLQQVKRCRLINGYGPTESTTFTCCYPITQSSFVGTSVFIGRPIANTHCFLVDSDLQPVAVGVSGELYIGGDGLARGYLNHPELTAERFIPNPFSNYPGSRLYKTGDLARYLPDGNIEFLGRIDNQVKIRGYRIELAEIETVLGQHPSVRETIVMAREDVSMGKHLVGYIVGNKENPPTINGLRSFLNEKLPDYMVPSAFIFLNALPLTPNGKVDRPALPTPEQGRLDLQKAFVAPRDALELQLVHIWEDFLNINNLGVRDNFFDLGGHSLLAVGLLAQIQKQFKREIPLSTLFQEGTIEHLATILRQQSGSQTRLPLVGVQPIGLKRPFFCIHPGSGGVLCYYYLARHLGPEQPFYALQAPGLEGEAEPYTQIEQMAAHYIEALHTVDPEGPYLLGGWSSGGTVAFEMAQQLQRQGHKVVLLALLDTLAPVSRNLPANDDDASWIIELAMANNLPLLADNFRHLELEAQLHYVLDQGRMANLVPPDSGILQLRRYLQVYKANLQALESYVPQIYSDQITLFRASENVPENFNEEVSERFRDSALGWSGFSDEPIKVVAVPGDHSTLIYEPHVRVVASLLKDCLDEAQAVYKN